MPRTKKCNHKIGGGILIIRGSMKGFGNDHTLWLSVLDEIIGGRFDEVHTTNLFSLFVVFTERQEL